MNIEQMKQKMLWLIKANIPGMIWGPPGVGKTQGVRQLCKEQKFVLIDVRLSQMEPVDVRGIPFREGNRTFWAIPSIWPDENDHKTIYVLFFDEINHAEQSTLAACFQAIQERQLGDYHFPKGTRFFGAGNRASDRGIHHVMPVPLKNRFIHLDVTSDLDDFCAHAMRAGFHQLITGFVRFSPRSLNELIEHSNTDEEFKRTSAVKNNNAIATPRTWEMVHNLLETATDPKSGELAYDEIKELVIGAVGQTSAVKFNGYVQFYKDLPDIDKLIKNPSNYDIPENLGMLFAIGVAISHKLNDTNIDTAIKYINRMPKDAQAYVMKDAVARDMSLLTTDAFSEWSDENANILF